MALAVGRGAGEEQSGAIGPNLTAAEFRGTQGVGDLHIRRPADPQQRPRWIVDPSGLLRPKGIDIDDLEHLVERCLVVACVHIGAGLGDVREVFLAEEVPAAQLGRVHADLGGVDVDDSFERERGLGATGSPIGADGCRVGDDRLSRGVDAVEGVVAARHDPTEHRKYRADRRVGTGVLHDVHSVCLKITVAGASERDSVVEAAAVGKVGHGLRPGLDPTNGSTDRPSGSADDEILDIVGVLPPKAPADIGRDDSTLLRCEAHCGHEPIAGAMRELGACPHRQVVVVPRSDGRAWLDRGDRQARVGELELDDHLTTVGHVAFDARRHLERPVRAEVREKQNVFGHRVLDCHDSIEGFDIRPDHLGGVDGLGNRLGEHDGVRLTDIADTVGGQPGAGHALIQQRVSRRFRRKPEISRGVHGSHTGHRFRLIGADRLHLAVSNHRSHEHGVEGIGRADVGDVPPAFGEQGGIFLADDAGADHRHGSSLRAGRSRVYAQLLSLLGSAATGLTIVAAVQIDLMTGSSSWEDAADLARKLEGAGFGGMLYTETTQVPWMQIAAASMAAPSLFFTTGIAVAFPQPDALCCDGVRDHRQHRGRFRLGLGSQVKAHVERRYSADFDRPAARMRDYVEAVKAAWRAFNREERLDHHGEFYEMTLLPPDWAPRRHDHEMKVDISAVGPMMTKVAAQVANGVHVHPLHSMAYLEHVFCPISPPAHERSGEIRARLS